MVFSDIGIYGYRKGIVQAYPLVIRPELGSVRNEQVTVSAKFLIMETNVAGEV